MRPTIAQLRGWNLGELDTVAQTIDAASKKLDVSVDGVVRDLDSAQHFWGGKAYNAAYSSASSEQSSTNHLSYAITGVADAVRGGRAALSAARDKILGIVDEAESKGLEVSDDGSTVSGPNGAMQSEAQRLAKDLRQALQSFEAADHTAAQDLRKAAGAVDEEHEAANYVSGSTAPAAFLPDSGRSHSSGGSGFGGGAAYGNSAGSSGGYGGGHGGGGSDGGGSYSNTGAPSYRPSGPPVFMNLDSHQMDVAKKIIEEGLRRGLSPQAIQIALATALTESGLRSLANSGIPESMMMANDGVGHDHDSVGPFQQRQSWGATADLMNPSTSAGKFYDALNKVDGWQNMSVAQAAQSVQRSAFPDAYAKYEAQAAQIFHQVTGR